MAAFVLTPHVDEAASLLAATMVAEQRLPILPSGTVYFQGGTLSYLIAPFVALGADTAADIAALRLVCVLVGAASVPLAFGMARSISGSARVGAFAALLVALDPVAVQWSAHLRMYAVLQPLALGFAWLVVALATGAVTWRRIGGLVGLAWAIVFTHVAGLALWPAAALGLWLAHRRSSWATRWRLGLAAVLSGTAPVTLLVLNRTLGSASVGDSAEPSDAFPSFVGDHLLALPTPPPPSEWSFSIADALAALPSVTTLAWLVPVLALLAGGLFATWLVVRSDSVGAGVPRAQLAILLGMGWMTAAVVWLGSAEPRARYLVHIHAIGWVVLAVATAGALARIHGWSRGADEAPRSTTVALLALVPLVLVAGLAWRLAHPVVHPDHGEALAYVAERRELGEPVVVALPAIAYLTPGTDDGIVFLAGPADRPRAQQLTRLSADGGLTDYWIGVPAITSAADLRAFMTANPDAWIVVDVERLEGDWAYAGPMADVLEAETRKVYAGTGEVLVLRPRAVLDTASGGSSS